MICQILVGAEGSGAAGRVRDGILLAGGATFRARNVVVTGFAGAALEARGNAAARLAAGGSSLDRAILHGNAEGGEQLKGGIEPNVQHEEAEPQLFDVRYGPNPDPRPRVGSPAVRPPGRAGRVADGAAYIGAFGEENWMEEWTTFGLDPVSFTPAVVGGDSQR